MQFQDCCQKRCSAMPASFTLELPPFRRPQIGKVIVRSIFDRTLFVLGRAALGGCTGRTADLDSGQYFNRGNNLALRIYGAAGPVRENDRTGRSDPGCVILGFPANEIVVPVMIMAYLSQGIITEPGSVETIRQLLIHHGWTQTTALCMMLFSLMHWPCSTTLLPLKRRQKSSNGHLLLFCSPP